MAQTRAQYALMKTELLTDPLVRNYAGMTHKQALADIYALVRQRNRTSMSGRDVANEVVSSQYDALTNTKKSQFLSLIGSNDLDPFGLAVTVVKDIFGAGSTTVNNLATARVETVSRVVELDLGSPGLGNIVEARN